ncbi:hypothetical protein HK096_003074 [Nowakowskiella sp. JEL0078]|nr:hypothetical protein HK096_003074 [Nowakowskiella sp. JEL0078]
MSDTNFFHAYVTESEFYFDLLHMFCTTIKFRSFETMKAGLLIAFFVASVSAQCTLPASLVSTESTWSGASIGLNTCGQSCVIEQNCYNCVSGNPLTDL